MFKAKPKPEAANPLAKRPEHRRWEMGDFADLAKRLAKRDLANGHRVLRQAACTACHVFDGEGLAIGPDLTAIGARFDTRAILESIIEPSKVIADKYRNVSLTTKQGELIEGRLVGEREKSLLIAPNAYQPSQVREVKLNMVATRKDSQFSPMPPGLVNSSPGRKSSTLWLLQAGRKINPTFDASPVRATLSAVRFRNIRKTVGCRGRVWPLDSFDRLVGQIHRRGCDCADSVRFDRGINLYDAADTCANGRGEELLAKALGDKRDEVVIAAKVGYDFVRWRSQGQREIEQDFSGIQSLRPKNVSNGSMNRIDIMQLHNVRAAQVDADEVWEALEELEQEGKLGCSGSRLARQSAGCTGVDCVQRRNPRIIQHIYNMLEQFPGNQINASTYTKSGKDNATTDDLADFQHGRMMEPELDTVSDSSDAQLGNA